MAKMASGRLPEVLSKYEAEIVDEWVQQQLSPGGIRKGLIREAELREQCREFLSLFVTAMSGGNSADVDAPEWAPVRDILASMSRSRSRAGFLPGETAVFVLSLKKPLFERLRQEHGSDAKGLADDVWVTTLLLDKLGIFTIEVYSKARDEVISRQQLELMELSTPVVKLWQGVVALPLIGTLDSARTQVVMENLLERIVETDAEIAIIDITGVPTVDTLVAQHLLKTVAAARLMGADCIISGIRPQIAQTIVHLGVVLTDVITKATLADAFALALQRTGMKIVNNNADAGA